MDEYTTAMTKTLLKCKQTISRLDTPLIKLTYSNYSNDIHYILIQNIREDLYFYIWIGNSSCQLGVLQLPFGMPNCNKMFVDVDFECVDYCGWDCIEIEFQKMDFNTVCNILGKKFKKNLMLAELAF